VLGVDSIVAVVDGVPITTQQLRRHAAPALHAIERAQAAGPERDEAVRKALSADLESAIDDRLFADEARRRAITVSDATVEETLGRMVAQLGGSREDYERSVWAQGWSREDVRDWIRRYVLAYLVLAYAWAREPAGAAARRPAPPDEFRGEWLERRKRAVCIERRVAVPK
jgi:peptidyl-prolyl cis-trans isomerase SurA